MSRKRPMNRSRLLMCAAAIFAAACQDRQPPSAAPSFLIQDAAHNGGNPHFFWLPPMTRQPTFTGTFDGTLSPVVEIRESAGPSPCVANRLVAMFTTTTGPTLETVRVDLVNQLYIVNWHTKAFNLNSACTYRIRFLVAELQLGIAEVDVVDNGAQLKRVDTDQFVPLLDDGTLPIKARVEFGAVTFALTGDATACRPGRDCGEAVVSPGQDAIVLTTAQTAGLFIPAAALREQIVVLIESRTDRPCIPRDRMALPQFDDCYRYEVTPTTSIERLSVRQAATGEVNTSYVFGDGKDETLADNVTVGMCVELGTLTPAQAARLDIFRFEPVEGTVNTLRDASASFLPCQSALGTTGSVGVSRALRRGWHLVVNQVHALFGARTAYASTSVVHEGLGGSTCCTSYFTWGLPAVLTANGAVTFIASPGSSVVPSVVVKDSGGTPMAGAMVTFAVGAGSGTIVGPNPVTTGADGIAQVSWALPASGTGPFSLTASAPGAAGSPVTFTAGTTAGFVYVANRLSNSVSGYAIDAATGSLAPIPGSPFAAGLHPVDIAADPSGRFLNVANMGDPRTSVFGNLSAYGIDPVTGVLTVIGGTPFAAAVFPEGVTVHPTGSFVYVANAGEVSAFSVDPVSGFLTRIPGSPFLAGSGPNDVGIDPSVQYVYVANVASADVSGFTIDAATGALTAMPGSPFPAGSEPIEVVLAPSGNFAYVMNHVSFNLSAYIIDATTGALTPIAGSPFPVGNTPTSMAVHPTRKFLYVASEGDNLSAFTINPTTGALTPIAGSPFDVGPVPFGVAVDQSGRFLYVSNRNAGTVSGFRIDEATGALTAVPGSPFAAGLDASNVAVAP